MFLGHAITAQQLFGQLLLGLINGSFYALLSLGLAVIFGMLNIINFAHGAQYMMGAFARLFPAALFRASTIGGADRLAADRRRDSASLIERLLLKRLRGLDPLYGLLLTFGLALVIEGLFRNYYGSSGLPYAMPDALRGGQQSRLHVPAQLSRLGDRASRSSCASPPGS